MKSWFYKSTEELPSTVQEGNVYFIDKGNVFIDINNARMESNIPYGLSLEYLNTFISGTPILDDTISFAVVTDTHNYASASNTVSQIESLGVNYLVHCGDFVDYGDKATLKSAVNSYEGNYNYLPTRGNHDGTLTSSYNTYMSESDLNEAFDNRDAYYYIDDTKSRIRFIVLNMIDRNVPTVASDPQHYYGIGYTQMNWLCNIALQTTEPGWKAILITHTPLAPLNDVAPYENGLQGWGNWEGAFYEEKTDGTGRDFIVSKVITYCNNAFNYNKVLEFDMSYDDGSGKQTIATTFNGNMEIIANLCGHVHWGNYDVKVNGVPCISFYDTETDKVGDNRIGVFSTVTIQKSRKTITIGEYDSANPTLPTVTASIKWGAPTIEQKEEVISLIELGTPLQGVFEDSENYSGKYRISFDAGKCTNYEGYNSSSGTWITYDGHWYVGGTIGGSPTNLINVVTVDPETGATTTMSYGSYSLFLMTRKIYEDVYGQTEFLTNKNQYIEFIIGSTKFYCYPYSDDGFYYSSTISINP